MKFVFFQNVLNHHAAPVADELYRILGNDFFFVELLGSTNTIDKKGVDADFSNRPYLIQAWRSEDYKKKSLELALSCDVACFGGFVAIDYQIERLKRNLFSYEISERWLKRGLINLLSPQQLKYIYHYYSDNWSHKKLFKLCASAYAAKDHYLLGMFRDKCYKWGYFIDSSKEQINCVNQNRDFDNTKRPLKILWCARFLKWKHPEFAINLAVKLKNDGCPFVLDMYGDGELFAFIDTLRNQKLVDDVVCLKGAVSNEIINKAMREHDIFLFTSDKNEGWGVVLNEAMKNGCVPIASIEAGSTPYLIKDGMNGYIFSQGDIAAVVKYVHQLYDHPSKRILMSTEAQRHISDVWSPEIAASHLLQLTNNLLADKETQFMEGPCSKAI